MNSIKDNQSVVQCNKSCQLPLIKLHVCTVIIHRDCATEKGKDELHEHV